MPTIIKGQPTSAEVRASLLAEGRPVLVAFSGGKDAIAATIALREAGIDVRLAHLYGIPGRTPGRGLDFVEESLRKLEDTLQLEVHRYPHPSLYRLINSAVFQPPERLAIIEAASLPNVDYVQLWKWIREDLDLDPDTWVADGVRAADSQMRRASLTRHGVMKPGNRKVSPVADWLIADVRAAMARAGVALPDEYRHFSRSFDGIDYRFLAPIAEHYPDDWARILDWFPLAELELLRPTLGTYTPGETE